MKRNLIQASHPKAQKRKGVCLSGLDYAVRSFDQNIEDFDLKWPPI